jgi:hypothetical protein
MIKYWIYLLLIVLNFGGCDRKNQDEQLLSQAATIHNQAIAIATQLRDTLSASTNQVPMDSLHVMLIELDDWEKNLIEVPGNEGEHLHPGEHNHDHTPIQITAEEMLRAQQEFKYQIESLSKRVEALTLN